MTDHSTKDLATFPVHQVQADQPLCRIHRSCHGALWYATTPDPGDGGRFDLPKQEGIGTCYLAVTDVAKFPEKFGRFSVITEENVDEHELSRLTPTTSLRLADLTDKTVLGEFGITGDIWAGTDYSPSQALAERLREAGFEGVYYATRHDPQLTERSLAVFGSAGAPESHGTERFRIDTASIPEELVRRVEDEFHLQVLPSQPLTDSDIDLGPG